MTTYSSNLTIVTALTKLEEDWVRKTTRGIGPADQTLGNFSVFTSLYFYVSWTIRNELKDLYFR